MRFSVKDRFDMQQPDPSWEYHNTRKGLEFYPEDTRLETSTSYQMPGVTDIFFTLYSKIQE
jgi:hypothetical protein